MAMRFPVILTFTNVCDKNEASWKLYSKVSFGRRRTTLLAVNKVINNGQLPEIHNSAKTHKTQLFFCINIFVPIEKEFGRGSLTAVNK